MLQGSRDQADICTTQCNALLCRENCWPSSEYSSCYPQRSASNTYLTAGLPTGPFVAKRSCWISTLSPFIDTSWRAGIQGSVIGHCIEVRLKLNSTAGFPVLLDPHNAKARRLLLPISPTPPRWGEGSTHRSVMVTIILDRYCAYIASRIRACSCIGPMTAEQLPWVKVFGMI